MEVNGSLLILLLNSKAYVPNAHSEAKPKMSVLGGEEVCCS